MYTISFIWGKYFRYKYVTGSYTLRKENALNCMFQGRNTEVVPPGIPGKMTVVCLVTDIM